MLNSTTIVPKLSADNKNISNTNNIKIVKTRKRTNRFFREIISSNVGNSFSRLIRECSLINGLASKSVLFGLSSY